MTEFQLQKYLQMVMDNVILKELYSWHFYVPAISHAEYMVLRLIKDCRKGAMTGFVYRNAPKSIFHSWVEINFESQWYELEAFILDKTYIKKLQERNPECRGAFCGYGVAVKDFRNLIIEFDRNNTYIQSEGINQDFGVYDCPDELLKEHHQEISAFKAFAYKHIGRHLMNRNVRKIRER